MPVAAAADPTQNDAAFSPQLAAALLAGRELLRRELGTDDPAEIVAMVRSLEAQLCDLYQDKEDEQETE